jgi:hypothetical protein
VYSLARGVSAAWPLSHPMRKRPTGLFLAFSPLMQRLRKMPYLQALPNGEGRNRTGDTTIFSRVLYQLSYLAEAC